jgi:hypothetical protein
MKLTKSKLQQIIKEELEQVMFEDYVGGGLEEADKNFGYNEWWDPKSYQTSDEDAPTWLRDKPTHMKPEYGRNEPGAAIGAGEYESGRGVGGSGVPAGPYQDAAPAGSGMDTQQTMASPAQLSSIEPTDRYMGMSVDWLKKRGWEWDPRMGDFHKTTGNKTRTLRQHMARWSGQRQQWNVKPSGERGGLPTSQD